MPSTQITWTIFTINHLNHAYAELVLPSTSCITKPILTKISIVSHRHPELAQPPPTLKLPKATLSEKKHHHHPELPNPLSLPSAAESRICSTISTLHYPKLPSTRFSSSSSSFIRCTRFRIFVANFQDHFRDFPDVDRQTSSFNLNTVESTAFSKSRNPAHRTRRQSLKDREIA